MWVAVRPPATADGMAAWQSALRELFTRYPGRIAILEMRFDREPDAFSRFALQIASTEARARRGQRRKWPSARTTFAAVERLAASLTAADAPYVDLLAAVGAGPHTSVFGAFSRAVPDGRLVVRRGVNDRDDESRARVVRDVLTTVATDTIATAWPVDDTLADALRALLPGVESADRCDRAARSRRRRPHARRCRRRGAARVAPPAVRCRDIYNVSRLRRGPVGRRLDCRVARGGQGPGGGDRSCPGRTATGGVRPGRTTRRRESRGRCP